MKSRSVDHLFSEIENLCVNIRQKEGYIEELQFELKRMNENEREILKETMSLREASTKMNHLIELFEQNRKEDQKQLLGEMRRVLQGQSGLVD